MGFYISGILGEISLKVFLSALNFLLLKKCKGFTNYDEIHNFERKLVVVHLLYTTSEITSIYTEILGSVYKEVG